ncbi:fumarylacetoacetate hydrolase family protein [Sphingomonas sp. Root710]|uniref:fumarylacetoacetate hydrolase family protein n=1 Tax=Sphingomonas sp. Root710 TaxID=1736594 RepID=UPI0009E91A2A|nr:fumarylacetoacetate hydrolase family protein [Sphingomonas sp. Root710]
MKLVTFRAADRDGIGAIHPDGFIVDFFGIGPRFPATMLDLIEAGEEAWAQAREWTGRAVAEARRPLGDVRLLAPLPRPARLRDAFLFLQHLEVAFRKMGREIHPEIRKNPMYVNSDHVHIFGPDADIPWPHHSDWIDYELEWACVIGKPGLRISRENARDHIFGYTIFNDWSARDLQLVYMETGAGPGSGKDFANGIGPCIATIDEFDDPYDLKMTAHVNGELWSEGTTATMAHRFEDAVHHLSQGAPLVAGEVIGSGTVLGGCGFELDRRLAIGDVVRLEIEGIGVLSNKIVTQPLS